MGIRDNLDKELARRLKVMTEESAKLRSLATELDHDKEKLTLKYLALLAGDLYFTISQADALNLEIESGFTGIEEIIFEIIGNQFVSISKEFVPPPRGGVCYRIAPNLIIDLKGVTYDNEYDS